MCTSQPARVCGSLIAIATPFDRDRLLNMGNVAEPTAEGNRTPRAYDAAGRRARAAANRAMIVDAAGDLFAAHGYASTTLDQIAERAGVNPKLVVANGPKRALLLAAFEQRMAGAEAAGAERAESTIARTLDGADAATVVERLADVALDGHERGIGLWTAFRTAAHDDEEIRRAYQHVAQGRSEVMRLGVQALAAHGLLRPGPVEGHVATLALLLGFDPYQLMVLDWGWSRDRLRAWLVATLASSLIAVSGGGDSP